MKKTNLIKLLAVTFYFLFLGWSFIYGFKPGKEIGHNLWSFLIDMIEILPCAFVLIGLLEVWIKRKTVEKHLGDKSGIKGYIWAVLLAGMTVGGMFVGLPVAYSLYNKGAKLSVVFTYIGAAAIARIPMTIFEASFLGLKFTVIRLTVSIPLLIVTSYLLGRYLEKKSYKIVMHK